MVRETTRDSYRLSIERHLLPYLGGIVLSQLSTIDLDEMLAAQARRGVRAPTRQYSIRVLRAALNAAVRKRVIPYNPTVGVDRVAVTRREPVVLTYAQARRLLDVVRTDRLGPLLTMLATTGLRRGEGLALVWDNWDRDAGSLSVERTLLYRPRQGFIRVPPKTRRSVRTITLPDIAMAALRDQARRQAEERLNSGPSWRDQGLIFTAETKPGAPLSGGTVVHALHRLCDASGVPRIRVHDLRHLMATAMAERGVPEAVRMSVLGHATSAMTSHYTHARPTSREAADAIDWVLGSAVDDIVDDIQAG